jgi:hypothetical protein
MSIIFDLRRRMTGNYIDPSHVERVAKALWELEEGKFGDWFEKKDEYRARARRILSEPNGWMNGGE